MLREPHTSLLDMIQAAERASRYVHSLDRDTFLHDDLTQYAVWAQIVILGEAVRRLPESWNEEHPHIPWAAIAGMRHRLVHGYDVIDWEVVWAVAARELPTLLPKLRKLMDDLG